MRRHYAAWIVVFLTLTGCVPPQDQQRFLATSASDWHFTPKEGVYGRENFVLDNRAHILVAPAPADAWLMQLSSSTGKQVNRHFAIQTYAQLRTWFPNSRFAARDSLTAAQALVLAKSLSMDYLVYPQLENWDDASGFGLGTHWPGAGGTDHVAAVITVVDVVSGRILQDWEIRGRSGLLTMFSDAPSRLVDKALGEWAEHLSGHSSQNTPYLEWF